ncbi:MAG TPA: hypothetical protein VGG72_26645 [Bryobacteraceae bacterium]|jgi:hypothetical protein
MAIRNVLSIMQDASCVAIQRAILFPGAVGLSKAVDELFHPMEPHSFRKEQLDVSAGDTE